MVETVVDVSSIGKAVARAPADDLAESLRDLIRAGNDAMPRNHQKALGPSEVGHPCPRHLAMALMHEQEHGDGGYDDPLASLIGTAFHNWLDWAAKQHNKKLGYEKWLAERKVEVRPGLSGTCDLYDTDTFTVIDHKVPGTTRFKKYTVGGPSSTYRGQGHLYGAGYRREGLRVDNIAIHWIPRAGTGLGSTRVWMEPYSQQLVDDILGRLDNVTLLIEALDVENVPSNYLHIPVVPDEDCRLCDWFDPTGDGTDPFHCPGDTKNSAPPPGLFDPK